MRDVYIIEASQLPVVKQSLLPVWDMGASVVDALDHNQPAPTALFVGNMMSAMLSDQTQLGAVIAERSGLSGVEVHTIDGACASGGLALRAACLAIASLEHEVVAVCGVEKMSNPGDPKHVTRCLATASDWAREGSKGETFLSLNARLHREYIERFCPSPDVMAPFSINAHARANNNPNALLKKPIDFDVYRDSRVIHDPLRLYDASPICDGAAALLLCNQDYAWKHARKGGLMIRIAGSAVATDTVGLDAREDLMWLKAADLSAKKAFRMSGVTPADVELLEPHDAYNVITMLSLEASGFANKGQAWHELTNGPRSFINEHGLRMMCSQGGLKGRGHPVGATGVYQVVEAFNQFRLQGGENQFDQLGIAFCQNIGGTGATVATHILVRD